MSLWGGQKLLRTPQLQATGHRAEQELLESSVCRQDNSLMASPREKGAVRFNPAATLRVQVPAKQAEELPHQELVGQAGLLNPKQLLFM